MDGQIHADILVAAATLADLAWEASSQLTRPIPRHLMVRAQELLRDAVRKPKPSRRHRTVFWHAYRNALQRLLSRKELAAQLGEIA